MEGFLEDQAKIGGDLNLQNLLEGGSQSFYISGVSGEDLEKAADVHIDLRDELYDEDHQKSKDFGRHSAIFRHPILKEIRNSPDFGPFLDKTSSVTEDKEIQKMILRPGNGKLVDDGAQVWIHYMSFPEGSKKPFDTTEKRRRLFTFKLNWENLPGLELSVRSMEFNEMGLFIVSPKYAYGSFGHPPRIEPNTRILFLIELLQMRASVDLPLFSKSPEKRQQAGFSANYKEAERFKNVGNQKFSKDDLLGALDCYNIALRILLEFATQEKLEVEMKNGLLYKIYTNKAECFLRLDEPDNVLEIFREVFWQGLPMNVNGKFFFRLAKALLQRGETTEASRAIEVALEIEPNHPEIVAAKKEILAVVAEEELKSRDLWKKIGKAHVNETTKESRDNNPSTPSGLPKPKTVISPLAPNSMKNMLQQFSAQAALSKLFGNKL